MPSKYLTDSIEKLEGYSVGALQTSSTMQWNPSRSIDITSPAGHKTAIYFGTSTNPDETQILYLENMESQTDNPEQKLKRVVCVLLVGGMPAEGLDELSETLGELYEHYYYESTHQPALPEPPSSVRVGLGEKYDRPEFYAVEE